MKTLNKPTSTKAVRPHFIGSLIGLVLAVLLPPVGLGISIYEFMRIKWEGRGPRGLALSGIIVASITLLAGIILVVIYGPIIAFFIVMTILGSGSDGHNAAQDDAKPFVSVIEQQGGQKICDNGNNGKGLDSTMPWYTTYYNAADDQATITRLRQDITGQAHQGNIILTVHQPGVPAVLKCRNNDGYTRTPGNGQVILELSVTDSGN